MSVKSYYLSHLQYCVHLEGRNVIESNITQLVMASTKEKAREAVKNAALLNGIDDSCILGIRIDDLIIGE